MSRKRGYIDCTRRVDRASGLVYSERIIPTLNYFGHALGPDWVHESPRLPITVERGSPTGANTLGHMASRIALSDLRALTPVHFVHVPWPVAQKLWDFLCLHKSSVSLYMWKLFATAYPRYFPEISDYCSLSTFRKKMPLRDYMKILKSDTLSWVTAISVHTDQVDRRELVDIAKVTNLAALNVTSSAITDELDVDEALSLGLNDRVIRSWSELAQSNGAFKYLRLLIIRFQDGVTENIFQHLSHFPSLVLVWIIGYPESTQESAKNMASDRGWTVHETKNPRQKTSDYLKDQKLFADLGTFPPELDIEGLPLLRFCLGEEIPKPRKWQVPMLFSRKVPTTPMNAKEKRPDQTAIENDHADNFKKQRRKPVLKAGGQKDMMGLLSEFQA